MEEPGAARGGKERKELTLAPGAALPPAQAHALADIRLNTALDGLFKDAGAARTALDQSRQSYGDEHTLDVLAQAPARMSPTRSEYLSERLDPANQGESPRAARARYAAQVLLDAEKRLGLHRVHEGNVASTLGSHRPAAAEPAEIEAPKAATQPEITQAAPPVLPAEVLDVVARADAVERKIVLVEDLATSLHQVAVIEQIERDFGIAERELKTLSKSFDASLMTVYGSGYAHAREEFNRIAATDPQGSALLLAGDPWRLGPLRSSPILEQAGIECADTDAAQKAAVVAGGIAEKLVVARKRHSDLVAGAQLAFLDKDLKPTKVIGRCKEESLAARTEGDRIRSEVKKIGPRGSEKDLVAAYHALTEEHRTIAVQTRPTIQTIVDGADKLRSVAEGGPER